ncbi:MAG: hypothetical protein AB7K09_21680 [Planctomycetota bacterium]
MMDPDLLNALYDERPEGKRAELPADDPRREQLDGLRGVRAALHASAASVPDPPRRLHDMLMTEAALELRLRETEALTDDIDPVASPSRRRAKRNTNSNANPRPARRGWQSVSAGQWVMLSSAAMLMITVSIVVFGGRGGGTSAPTAYDGAAPPGSMGPGYAPRTLITAAANAAADSAHWADNASSNMPATNSPAANNFSSNANRNSGNSNSGPPSQVLTLPVAALEQRLDGYLPRVSLGQWMTKGGDIDLDQALADTTHDASRGLASSKAAMAVCEVAWSVYRHPLASESQRRDALLLIVDHGAREDDPKLTEAQRAADQILYDAHRPAWYSRHAAAPANPESNTPQKEQEREQQQRQQEDDQQQRKE